MTYILIFLARSYQELYRYNLHPLPSSCIVFEKKPKFTFLHTEISRNVLDWGDRGLTFLFKKQDLIIFDIKSKPKLHLNNEHNICLM